MKPNWFAIFMLLIVVLPGVQSCKAISDFFAEDGPEVVAEAAGSKLTRQELDKVIPNGGNPEDSSLFASQYINSWALDQLFLKRAESQLSEDEKDVTKELEEYRRSLLKYRYEQRYINERLDTIVSIDSISAFYERHQDRFVLQRPIVKVRYMRILSDSPMLETIKKKMSSSNANDIYEADSLAQIAAYKFKTWNDDWIDVTVLAKEYGADYTSIVSSIKQGWVEYTDTLGLMDVAYVSDMVRSGKMAPLEYSSPYIKDMIISARKKQLISDLENELLKNALANGEFVIY